MKNLWMLLLLGGLLIALTSQACLYPEEEDGKCTDCVSVQVLVEGYCYEKLRGCLLHKVGPVCQMCQNGYVLSEGTCVREAVYFGLGVDTDVPPVIIDDQAIARKEIVDNVAEKYGSEVSKAAGFMLEKHESVLSNSQIVEAQSWTSKRSSLARIIFSTNDQQYLTIVLINQESKLTQIQFTSLNAGQKVTTFQQTSDLIAEELGEKITTTTLYDILYKNQVLVYVYLGNNQEVYRVRVSEDQVVTYEVLDASKLAFEEVLTLHPYLAKYELTRLTDRSNQNTSIYVFELGDIISVSVQFDGTAFIVNNPIRLPDPVPNDGPLLGGFAPFDDYEDIRYQAVKSFVEAQFSELLSLQVQRVEFQIVAGMNFLFYYTNKDEENPINFKVKVYHSLQSKIELLSAQRNGVSMFSMNYNYNEDDQFLLAYGRFKVDSKVIPIPAIANVQRRVDEKVIKYRVNYPSNIYAEFNYDRQTDTVDVISYVIDGQNILLLRLKLSAEDRDPQVLFNFIKNQHPQILKRGYIQSVEKQRTSNTYKMTIVAPEGTYQAEIEDTGNLNLLNFIKVSDVTCFELKLPQALETDQYSQISNHLYQRYEIDGYELKVFQIKVGSTIDKYRLLYTNQKGQKVQFIFQKFLQKINLTQAFLLSYGYGVLLMDQADSRFGEVAAMGKSLLKIENNPFFAEQNGTHIRLFYETEEETVKVVINSENEVSLELIQKSSHILIPTGFDESKLLSKKERDTDEGFIKISAGIVEKYREYLADGEVIYAQKESDLEVVEYRILFKVGDKYFRVDALSHSEIIQVGTLFITPYTEADFTKCTQLDETGKHCLSCSEDEVEYQGNCFVKDPLCLVQAGEICIRCEDTSIMGDNFQCLRECSTLL